MTKRVVRCPYRVAGNVFMPMIALADGAFVCAKCGHLEMQLRPQVSLPQVHRVANAWLPSMRVKSTGMPRRPIR